MTSMVMVCFLSLSFYLPLSLSLFLPPLFLSFSLSLSLSLCLFTIYLSLSLTVSLCLYPYSSSLSASPYLHFPLTTFKPKGGSVSVNQSVRRTSVS